MQDRTHQKQGHEAIQYGDRKQQNTVKEHSRKQGQNTP